MTGRPAVSRPHWSQDLERYQAGVVLGLVAAILAVRAARSVVFDVSAFDPLVYVVVVLIFLLTAGAASILPVRRALRVDPIVTLRAD